VKTYAAKNIATKYVYGVNLALKLKVKSSQTILSLRTGLRRREQVDHENKGRGLLK